jgi:hypothetical protein
MIKAWIVEHKLKLGVAAALTLLVPPMGGAVGGGSQAYVAVNAAENAAAITVVAGQTTTPFSECPDEASVEILKDGFTVYSPILGEFELDENCQGSIDVPYEQFASENGDYTAKIEMGSDTYETVFRVNKIANWVFVRAQSDAQNERTKVSVALSKAQSQPLQSAVFTSGELVLDVYWEDCEDERSTVPGPLPTSDGSCQANGQNVFHATVHWNRTANTNLIIPWDNFENPTRNGDKPPEGQYNVTATFHNDEALANDNVPMDPTVFDRDPPGNWFEVDRE